MAAIAGGTFAFIVANYANPDMVGHTGDWDAAVAALEVIDGCLGRVADAVLAAGAALVITADHGNVERDAGRRRADRRPRTPPPTSRSSSSVDGRERRQLRDGALADVAPTICALLEIPIGPGMTGQQPARR